MATNSLEKTKAEIIKRLETEIENSLVPGTKGILSVEFFRDSQEYENRMVITVTYNPFDPDPIVEIRRESSTTQFEILHRNK